MKATFEKILVGILPEYFRNFLGFLYGLIYYPKRSYSQYGEDLIIMSYFSRLGIKRGFYVDIGAYHPKFISNTYLLHKKGWQGICVDLDEGKLKWFKLMRGKAVETLCAGIVGANTLENQSIAFYKHKRLFSELDTIKLEVATANERNKGWGFITQQVPLMGINQLLKSLQENVDFLNIDVEGVDEDILLNLNFSEFQPKVILFEDNNTFGGSERVKMLLVENGYSHLFSSGGSVAYYLKFELRNMSS